LNQLNKKLYLALILVIILSFSFTRMIKAHSSEVNAPDEVLTFLEDVVKLDLTKYDLELLGTTVSYPTELGGLIQISGKFALQSKTSKLDVLFNFKNNTLSWCLMRVIEGSPHYGIQMSTDICDNTKDLLQRYQTYTGDSELETMKSMLDIVDVTKNTTETTDNVKITVSNTAESTSLDWRYTFNDADYMGVSVSFRDGTFHSFSDTRNLYTIGRTDVNISREKAIILSLMYAENLKWTIGDVEVTDFNIVEEGTEPELLTRSRDEPLKLYPYWYVLLHLDDLYPGNIRHIQVMLWADTGELIDCQPLSFGGGAPHELINTEASATPEQPVSLTTQQNEDAFLSICTPLIAVAATIIIAITILIRKKNLK
jgi:hypothetical protein